MKRIGLLLGLAMSLMISSVTFAGIPEIVIDGVVVQERQESCIVEEIKKVQQMYIEDRALGNNWEYRMSGSSCRTFEEAFAQGVRRTQCADGTNKILKGAGVIPLDTGHFFGNKNGDISWGGNSKAVIESVADVYHYNNGTTIGQLRAQGVLQPGDVITYVGFHHTNIYAGNNYWWDSGHAHCTRSGEGAPFWTFYSERNNDGLQIGCLIRFRNQFPTPARPEITIENVSSPVDMDGEDDGIFIWPSDDGWEDYMDGVEIETIETEEEDVDPVSMHSMIDKPMLEQKRNMGVSKALTIAVK